jgi:molybdenum cofactor cytidylyltransferase
LATWRGNTLLGRAVGNLQGVCDLGVWVVAAPGDEPVTELVRAAGARLVINNRHASGMGSSIVAAVAELPAETDGVVITLCDQPRAGTGELNDLISAWRTNPRLPAAAAYSGILGVPALFPRDHFPALLSLSGDMGARSLLRNSDSITAVDMPGAAYDVDSPEALARLSDEAPRS